MIKDEQEALSRKYSNDVIILLRLSSGNLAVFNNARELTGITTDRDIVNAFNLIECQLWRASKTALPNDPTALIEQIDLTKI